MEKTTERNNGEFNVSRALTEATESADLSLSMRQVLVGALTEMGGPTEFGREIVRLFKSHETSAASKAAIAANLMKMLGIYGNEDDNDDLTPDSMLERWEELQRMGERREVIDSIQDGRDD